jgi:hypothetical protein
MGQFDWVHHFIPFYPSFHDRLHHYTSGQTHTLYETILQKI